MVPTFKHMYGFALLASVYAFPMNGVFNNDVGGGDETIDLSDLGKSIYGSPKVSSGARLDEWDSSKGNAEEMGEYAQGDILFPAENGRNGLKAESSRWANGVIPYVIEGSFTSEQRENIMKAIADYHRLTCLRFVPFNGQANYISINNIRAGCYSSVGMVGGRQDVNLQSPGCVNAKGTIVHELMHAVGFLHEQSRFERDKFVNIYFQNVKQGEEHNFNKASEDKTSGFGVGYDYNSVMHYSEYAFSSNGKPTIAAKSNAKFGQRVGLSQGDVKKINAMYKCNKDLPAKGWDNSVWTGSG